MGTRCFTEIRPGGQTASRGAADTGALGLNGRLHSHLEFQFYQWRFATRSVESGYFINL